MDVCSVARWLDAIESLGVKDMSVCCFLELEDPVCQRMRQEFQKVSEELSRYTNMVLVEEIDFSLDIVEKLLEKDSRVSISSLPAFMIFFKGKPMVIQRVGYQEDWLINGPLTASQLTNLVRYSLEFLNANEHTEVLPCDI